MDDATWRHSGLPFGHASHNRGRRKTAATSRRAALKAVGPVVYAARLADGTIKIGWTTELHDRLRYLVHYVGQDVELLAFRLGTIEDEQAIHADLAPHRSLHTERSREYYSPTPEVLAVVNGMREGLHLLPVRR